VETIQRSGCHGCAAKSACGTGLLGDYLSGASRIRVALNGHNLAEISLHDRVVIGIPENTLATGALRVYLLPLLMLVIGALAGEKLAGEAGAVFGALCGLLAGAAAVRWHSRRQAANPAYIPQLLRIEPDPPA
jgi:sigma-E factor negative regulatory protein RseC